jgi:hypothetical protein
MQPISGKSGFELHTPAKFGEHCAIDLVGEAEQTDLQNVSMMHEFFSY